MLELRNIKKDYPAGDGTVHALKGIDLQFRESEFVAILGPSGCGKTTMLNLIGGLDQYTEGDLIINGKSTKDFKDRDWDTYRNHSVGFVFQSYNLIPHQSVLQNVELALSLSGVPKSQRRKRAKQALEQVGLSTQLNKKPGQMSGGQMQRVAIARAIVNNPDIILADEPTGALDTETSTQVMDILKEISKDRLVIMVTHNPDLANRYATRIIHMLDGEITHDSDPFTHEELQPVEERVPMMLGTGSTPQKREKKPSLSFATSFGLSLKNLFTKKGRTLLTAFAGSIGIIGIALIFAVSNGLTTYINTVQEDTLSSYPLTLQATHTDMGSIMQSFMGGGESKYQHEKDAVYTKPMIYDMIESLNNMETIDNDLKAFKVYLEEKLAANDGDNALNEAVNGVQYTYDLDLQIYTENVDGTVIRSDSQALMQELLIEHMGLDLSAMTEMEGGAGMMSNSMMSMMPNMNSVLWQEMLSGENGELINPLLEKQYDVIYGQWPEAFNEIVLVVDENNELEDLTFYAMGLESKEYIDALMKAALNKGELTAEMQKWTYEEICNMEFRTVLNSDCYTYDEKTGTYADLRESQAGMKYLYDNGISLKVSGIIRPNETAVSAMLSGSIAYTKALTEYVIAQGKDSAAIQAQTDQPHRDIFTGLPFQENTDDLTQAEKAEEFKSYIKDLNEQKKAETYVKIQSIPSAEQVEQALQQAKEQLDQDQLKAQMADALSKQMNMSQEKIDEYISGMTDEDLDKLFTQMMTEKIKADYAAQVAQQLSAMTSQQLAMAMDSAVAGYTEEQCATYYEEILEFSESTYEENLVQLGCVDLSDPATINLYASSFENKDIIEEAITEYNEGVEELSRIQYTDYVGLMMSSITTIINAISYVLIAFVAISLVVSSIMIGVITLISVQERTKEIGILRAIGASKRNVSRMFNAETVMIGFAAGVLGVGVTYLLCIPINFIIQTLTGIPGISAVLPWPIAIVLVLISMGLTLFAGIIPSRSAAKKDPVVALRTE